MATSTPEEEFHNIRAEASEQQRCKTDAAALEELRAWGEREGHNSSAIARMLGIKRQAVSSWQRIPAERVRQVSQLTGIPAWRLRPDLFDQPLDASPEAPQNT